MTSPVQMGWLDQIVGFNFVTYGDIFYLVPAATKENFALPWTPTVCTVTASNCELNGFVLFDTTTTLLGVGQPAPVLLPPPPSSVIKTTFPFSAITSYMATNYNIWRYDVNKYSAGGFADGGRQQTCAINLGRIKKKFPSIGTILMTCTFTTITGFFLVDIKSGWAAKAKHTSQPDPFVQDANYLNELALSSPTFNVSIPISNPAGGTVT